MYATERQARDAVAKLLEEGFRAEEIFLVTPGSSIAAPPLATISSAMLAGEVLGSQAKFYAEGVKQGRSVVAISAPFGTGKLANSVLDSFNPLDMGLQPSETPPPAWEEAAPLSSAFLLPILKRGQPAPLSAFLGLGTLSRGRSVLAGMFGELTSSDFAVFGRNPLTRNQAGWASLSGKSGPSWRTSFGFPMLSRNPAPLSSAFGMHVLAKPNLSRQAAPLSEITGLPTLSRGRTFLSRLFGELGSSSFALFGRNPLTRNAAPLSSLFGLSTLSQQKGAWTSSFGLPLLSGNQKPVSSKLGLPLLIGHR
jgi:hypothetical protein